MARLLVVDDDPQLLQALGEYLGACGHTVRTAASGAEALTALIECPPDLVVSDVLMEGMDGFELHRRVSSLTGGAMPFLFLTGRSERSQRLKGLRAGADDYVVKPFDPDELEARVATVLARVERTREQERLEARRAHAAALAEASEQLGTRAAAMVQQLGKLRTQMVAAGRYAPRAQVDSALELAGEIESLIGSLAATAGSGGEESPVERTPQRIAPIVRGAAAGAARRAAERGVELHITCGGLLSGNVDAEALHRALGGLLESAVDLSPVGSHVAIRARRSEEGGLEITITDGGRDAPGAQVEAVDVAAYRTLETARHVVHAHGGRLDATAEQGGAVRLTMWLPGRVARHVGRRG